MELAVEKIALMEASWLKALKGEFEKPYMKKLEAFIAKEAVVYPPFELIFNAFCQTPFDAVKVVIMGQDPYHGEGQAHGLSFSVPNGTPAPPSLLNIYKEIRNDLGFDIPISGNLEGWAKQGVLLLNATLTVRAGEAKSHYGQGWEIFTDRVIELLSEKKDPIVFLLWGKSAQEKFSKVKLKWNHLVLKSVHPSPLSAYRGFFGRKHFSKANEFLMSVSKTPVDWRIQ